MMRTLVEGQTGDPNVGPRKLVVVLIVLVVVLAVFGPKRIKSLGSDMGNAIKGFRNAVREKAPLGWA